jgi:hypothetical protein
VSLAKGEKPVRFEVYNTADRDEFLGWLDHPGPEDIVQKGRLTVSTVEGDVELDFQRNPAGEPHWVFLSPGHPVLEVVGFTPARED